jgi:hypothetical protein
MRVPRYSRFLAGTLLLALALALALSSAASGSPPVRRTVKSTAFIALPQVAREFRATVPTPTATPSSTPTPPAMPGKPQAGAWSGKDSEGLPVSFTVNADNTVATFFLMIYWPGYNDCHGAFLTFTIGGPLAIAGSQFSGSLDNFSFSGSFSSRTTAEGDYSFVDAGQPCGRFPRSGTWSARPDPTATPGASAPRTWG